MKVDEGELYSIATKFRQAIEHSDMSEEAVGREGHLRMKKFTNGACSEACTLLGLYLVEKLGIEPLAERCGQMEEGDQWYGSHHWLEHDGIIIDIAADQFPMVTEPVIVSRDSNFHNKYAQQKGTITNSFAAENETDWMLALYDAVKSTLDDENFKVV